MWNGTNKKSKNGAVADLAEMETDLQNIVDSVIGEEYLINATGQSDLSNVNYLDIVIDTQVQSVFELCDFLPKLKTLVLDHSNISSVRDLGTGLRQITSLSLCACGLHDIDGIGVLSGLEELCLNDNHITDVSPLAMHDSLQVLKVTDNNLSDISAADDLSSCICLISLHISGNPLERAPNIELIIASIITSLKDIDGMPVDPDAHSKVTNTMILEAASAMRLIQEEIEDERRMESNMLEENNGGFSRPMGVSVNSSINSNSGVGHHGKTTGVETDTGSDLTHGSSVVLAGNMASAMRKRRNQLAVSTEGDVMGGLASGPASLKASSSSTNNGPPSSFSKGGDRKASSGGVSPSLLIVDDPESALSVLDSALIASSAPGSLSSTVGGPKSLSSPSPYLFTQFLKEGDITAQAKGKEKLFQPASASKSKKGQGGGRRQGVISDDEGGDDDDDDDEAPAYTTYWDDDDDEDEGRMTRRSPRGAGSAEVSGSSTRFGGLQNPEVVASPQRQPQPSTRPRSSRQNSGSSSSSSRPKTSSTATAEMMMLNGNRPPSNHSNSSSPRPGSSTGSNRKKVENAATAENVRKVPSLEINGNSSRPLSKQLSGRPHSTQSNASFTSNASNSSFGSDVDSSRPGTADSGGSNTNRSTANIAFFSAPFKIEAADTDVQKVKTQLKSSSMKAAGARLGNASATGCADECTSPEGGHSSSSIISSSSGNSRITQQPSSIVHQDMVIRRKAQTRGIAGALEDSQEFPSGFNANEDTASATENGGVISKPNIRMSKSSATKNALYPSMGNIDKVGKMMMGDNEEDEEEEGEVVVGRRFSGRNKNGDNDSSSDEDIAVDHATRHQLMGSSTSRKTAFGNSTNNNMGANTENSVQRDSLGAAATSSGMFGSSSSTSPFHRPSTAGRPGSASGGGGGGDGTSLFQRTTQSSVAGTALGFNLEGSLAAIEKWVHDMSSDEEEENDDGDHEDDDEGEEGGEEKDERLEPLELHNSPRRVAGTGNRGMTTGVYSHQSSAAPYTNTHKGTTTTTTGTAYSAVLTSPVKGSPNSHSQDGTTAFSIGSTTSAPSGSASKEMILDRNAIYDMCSQSGQQQHLQRSSRGSTPPSSAGGSSVRKQQHSGNNNTNNNNSSNHDRLREQSRKDDQRDAAEDDEDVDFSSRGTTPSSTRPSTGTNTHRSTASPRTTTTTTTAASAATAAGAVYGFDDSSGATATGARAAAQLTSKAIFDEKYKSSKSTATQNRSDDEISLLSGTGGAISSHRQLQQQQQQHQQHQLVMSSSSSSSSSGCSSSSSSSLEQPRAKLRASKSPFAAAAQLSLAPSGGDSSSPQQLLPSGPTYITSGDASRSRAGDASAPSFTSTTSDRYVKSASAGNGAAAECSENTEVPQSDGSPARFTTEGSTAAGSAAASNNSRNKGKGVELPDAELIELLRKPPKTTLILRTKGNFQEFFKGISAPRMKHLLEQAYADIEVEAERVQKVAKRMNLLTDVFG